VSIQGPSEKEGLASANYEERGGEKGTSVPPSKKGRVRDGSAKGKRRGNRISFLHRTGVRARHLSS